MPPETRKEIDERRRNHRIKNNGSGKKFMHARTQHTGLPYNPDQQEKRQKNSQGDAKNSKGKHVTPKKASKTSMAKAKKSKTKR